MLRKQSIIILSVSMGALVACQNAGGKASPANFLICENEGGRPFEMLEENGRAVVMCQFSDGRQVATSDL